MNANKIVQQFTFAGHALMLTAVGVAILCDHVVGVARTPANVAVAVGMIVASGLLVADAFGVLPRPWVRTAWGMVVVVAVAFVGLNCV